MYETPGDLRAIAARRTREERGDLGRTVAACFANFRHFCGLLKIQPKEGRGRIPLVLSPIQRAYCDVRTSRDIILKPRQCHMTTGEVARDLWWFLTRRGARVVVVCQSQTEGAALKDIAYKVRLFVDSLRELGVVLPFGTESGVEWTLPKRDATLRIIQAGASEMSASKKGRGGTINRLHFTEAAFFEHAADTFNSLMESVPKDDTEVVNESTPNGAAGFYFDQWQAAVSERSGFTPHFFGWWQHSEYSIPLEPGETVAPETPLEVALAGAGASPEALKWRRWKVRDKGGDQTLVTQEFPNDPITCFLLSGRTFFDRDVLTDLVRKAKEPIEILPIRTPGAHGELRIFAHPKPGEDYCATADTSEGTGGDDSAVTVREFTTGRHMATLYGQFKPWELARALAGICFRYNGAPGRSPGALAVVERNNHGHTVLRALDAEQHYKRIFYDRDGLPGWLTHEVTRGPALSTLEQAIRSGWWTSPDMVVLGEMRTFVIHERANGRSKAEAASGAKDDLVMCEAINWDVLSRPVVQRNTNNYVG